MNFFKNITLLLVTGSVLTLTLGIQGASAQIRAEQAFREYTNPDELVTFDRSTDFARALDVINDFAQLNRGKVVIDRTGTTGSIGISVPAMHWMDALQLILNVKGLALVEKQDYFEIVENVRPGSGQSTSQNSGTGTATDEIVVTTETREVRINAIFFEGNRRALQEIGVDWSTLSENVPENVSDFVSPEGGGGGGDGQFPSTEFDGPFVQVNSKGAQNVSQNVFNALVNFGGIGNTGIEVQALFSAFEADNLGEILASPSIKVMEGQEGSIQVGQDFSIKQRDIAGNVLDEFVSVGTILTVTPLVFTQDDTTFIHLTIEAERSSAQPDPVSTIINKQEASTQAILMDGEATVIAGLYRTEQSEVRRGIPILKDLPPWLFGLRYLFGYNAKDYQMNELIILVQATIEPTIPERFGQDEFSNKFDLLREERENMRNEMLQYKNGAFEFVDPLEPESNVEKEPLRDIPKEELVQENEVDPFAVKPDTAAPDNSQTEVPKQSQTSPLVRDPELQTKVIPLNFTSGTNDNGQELLSSSNTEQEKQSADAPPVKEAATTKAGPADGSAGYVYYVIGGSFQNKSNAEMLNRQLKAEGFNSTIISRTDKEMYMVTFSKFINLSEAKTALADIQEYKNPGAWLYKVRNQADGL
jgi:type IV pilus assembly protein PilQ